MNGAKQKDELYFPKVLEDIMKKRKCTIREMAAILEFSPTYISDLKRGNRMPSELVIERLKEAGPTLCLTQEELELLEDAYCLDKETLPIELIRYLVANGLVGVLSQLAPLDPTGAKLRDFGYGLIRAKRPNGPTQKP